MLALEDAPRSFSEACQSVEEPEMLGIYSEFYLGLGRTMELRARDTLSLHRIYVSQSFKEMCAIRTTRTLL